MTTLTKDVKEKLIRNLLLASPLCEEAKALVAARVALVKEIREAILKQVKTTDANIADQIKYIGGLDAINGFTNPTARSITPEYFVKVGLNGEYRSLAWDGLDSFRVDVPHETPPRKYVSLALDSKRFFGHGVFPEVKYPHGMIEYVLLTKVGNLKERLDASDVQCKEMYCKVSQFILTVRGALAQVRTVKQLEKAWPDAVALLPKPETAKKTSSTGVALSVEDLNALCGLPK